MLGFDLHNVMTPFITMRPSFYPLGCDACNCDIHGSSSLNCNKQSGNCSCKTLVVGRKCDSCLGGFYYGLDQYHPTGCLKCQCSGKTNNCSSKANMYESSVVTDLNAADTDDMETLQNWTITGGIRIGGGIDSILSNFR